MYLPLESLAQGYWFQRREQPNNAIRLKEEKITREDQTTKEKKEKIISQIVNVNLVSGDEYPWSVSSNDLLADDWDVYDPEAEESKEKGE